MLCYKSRTEYSVKFIVYCYIISNNRTKFIVNTIILKNRKKSIKLDDCMIRANYRKRKEGFSEPFLIIDKMAIYYKKKLLVRRYSYVKRNMDYWFGRLESFTNYIFLTSLWFFDLVSDVIIWRDDLLYSIRIQHLVKRTEGLILDDSEGRVYINNIGDESF